MDKLKLWGPPFVGLSFFLSVSLPLFAYTTSLALFGLFHVTRELSYIESRFGPRIKKGLAIRLFALLSLVVILRLLTIAQVLQPALSHQMEVGIVILLSLAAWPLGSIFASGLSFIFVSLLITGVLISPSYTLLTMAILHNWTPIAFIAEASPKKSRSLSLGLCLVLFGLLPLFIASGVPFLWLARFGLIWPEVEILPAGPLASHLGAYLPSFFHGHTHALYAFSAIVFAQLLHYGAVIFVLPTYVKEVESPSWLRFAIFGLCSLLLIKFTLDFSAARSLYGIAAAVHAWIEIPIFFLALSQSFRNKELKSSYSGFHAAT